MTRTGPRRSARRGARPRARVASSSGGGSERSSLISTPARAMPPRASPRSSRRGRAAICALSAFPQRMNAANVHARMTHDLVDTSIL
eukprot:30796-Pelagococcus_subviridis.AAC.8